MLLRVSEAVGVGVISTGLAGRLVRLEYEISVEKMINRISIVKIINKNTKNVNLSNMRGF